VERRVHPVLQDARMVTPSYLQRSDGVISAMGCGMRLPLLQLCRRGLGSLTGRTARWARLPLDFTAKRWRTPGSRGSMTPAPHRTGEDE
jgi:hypothetical protein